MKSYDCCMKQFDVIHPRKRVPAFSPYDWCGNRLPRELCECYGRYSDAKWYAHQYCTRLYNQCEGTDFAITSHNTFMFVVMFNFVNPGNGRPMVARITRNHNECWYTD